MKSVFEDRSCVGSHTRGIPTDWQHSTRECDGCGRIFKFTELIYHAKPADYYEIPVHEAEVNKV